LRGECHGSGWGIATYNGRPNIIRSINAAYEDPQFAQYARSSATLAMAHVRQASVGAPSIENTHPFAYDRWIFAHNGTLEGFADGKQRLLQETPPDLRNQIGGATDSEHVFYFWLGRLRSIAGGVSSEVSVEQLTASLQETVQLIADWFPAPLGEATRLNFLITNGQLLAATRWKHSLSMLIRNSPSGSAGSVLIASEPATAESWQEVPDGTLLIVDQQLDVHSAKLVA
jgi:glutamine amidotransferase